jgi:ornithine cyclodeaminase
VTAGDQLLLLGGGAIRAALNGREREIIEVVKAAYTTYGRGDQALPHSSFLRFPGDDRNRIIALPAYLGAPFGVAGIKWIASFPGNLDRGIERASAILVLNSIETGRPTAILEASIISAKRTAASAALAAESLHPDRTVDAVALVGCGPINFEVARFLRAVFPGLRQLVLIDTARQRAEQFRDRVAAQGWGLAVELGAARLEDARACPVVSFATNASRPYLHHAGAFAPGTTVLHVSLRDLAPEMILQVVNVVDDIDHVCRAQTSIHLAEQAVGNHDFIHAELAGVLASSAPIRRRPEDVVVFSPFGLGVLDVALGQWVVRDSAASDRGVVIDEFLPPHWQEAR